jgi:prepilin-type N-terminal cleavage/methylation domain-containing protein
MIKIGKTTSAFNKSASAGFTLIETLVAIAVLMIAIAGPLSIAYKALAASLYARDQSIASFLAQEEMEILKNIRQNLVSSTGSFASSDLITCDYNGNICDISISEYLSGANYIDKYNSPTASSLYFSSNKGYTHDINDRKTLFSRYFFLTNKGADDYQATVVVSWNEGAVSNEVRIISELVNNVL